MKAIERADNERPTRLGQTRLRAGEEEPAREDGEAGEAQQREHDHLPDLKTGDAEDVAEENALCLPGVGGIELEKKRAQAERHGEHHADGEIAVAELVARRTHDETRADGEQQHPFQRTQAQNGPRPPRRRKPMCDKAWAAKPSVADDDESSRRSRRESRRACRPSARSGRNRSRGNFASVLSMVVIVVRAFGLGDVTFRGNNEDPVFHPHDIDVETVELR